MITITIDDEHRAPKTCKLKGNGTAVWAEMSPGEMLQALRALYEASAAMEQLIEQRLVKAQTSEGGAVES